MGLVSVIVNGVLSADLKEVVPYCRECWTYEAGWWWLVSGYIQQDNVVHVVKNILLLQKGNGVSFYQAETDQDPAVTNSFKYEGMIVGLEYNTLLPKMFALGQTILLGKAGRNNEIWESKKT